MLKSFVYSWTIYWGLILLLTVHSIYPSATLAFLLQMTFVALVSVGYLIARLSTLGVRAPDSRTGHIPAARSVVRMSIYLSVFGLLFLVYDKVAIQGIDYSEGLAVAREQWRVIGEEREGTASSIWSALGYLIGSAYYVTIVMLLTQPQSFSARERLGIASTAFIFALLNSVITGGRSNFMLLGVFAVAAMSARRNLSIRLIFPDRRQRRALSAVTFLALAYMVYVFYARAEAGGELVSLYVVNFLPYMGLDFDNWYLQASSNESVATVGNMTILVGGYLSHSLATFAAILDVPQEDKIMLFGNAASILYKLGLTGKPDDGWFLAGRFPSVPGALWHQYGPAGFLLGSVLLGVVAGLTTAWASLASCRLLTLGMYAMVSATLILTPYVFAPDFLSFPFVFSSFVMLSVFARFGFEQRRAKSRKRPPAHQINRAPQHFS